VVVWRGLGGVVDIYPSGSVSTLSLNKRVNNMVNHGMIKHVEGKERKTLRFADVSGDDRDGFLYINMFNGTVTAWYNGESIPR
jgi:hypothetical protein